MTEPATPTMTPEEVEQWAALCRAGLLFKAQEERDEVCPDCLGWKHHTSLRCRDCERERRLREPKPFRYKIAEHSFLSRQ